MTPSYVSRLLLLSSACFFLVQFVAGGLLSLFAPVAIRRAGTMPPQAGARLLFTLRLLPAGLSAICIAILCVPSYLRFEPRVAEEEVGFACLACAILGALLCAVAVSRALGAWIRSSRYVRACQGRQFLLDGEPVWIIQQNAGLALAGILRPRLLISGAAMRDLSSDQLEVALRHERAHQAARDNLKRLLLLLAPPIFPAHRSLEQAWVKFAEWAADDQAAEGDPNRSTALAEALVRVARLQAGITMPPLVVSLVEAGEDLSSRVDRLLESPAYAPTRHAETFALGAITLVLVFLAATPTSLHAVHQLLELLLD
jgi:beta-lactamase regulating signal transducer with metallopeptidase domain